MHLRRPPSPATLRLVNSMYGPLSLRTKPVQPTAHKPADVDRQLDLADQLVERQDDSIPQT